MNYPLLSFTSTICFLFTVIILIFIQIQAVIFMEKWLSNRCWQMGRYENIADNKGRRIGCCDVKLIWNCYIFIEMSLKVVAKAPAQYWQLRYDVESIEHCQHLHKMKTAHVLNCWNEGLSR